MDAHTKIKTTHYPRYSNQSYHHFCSVFQIAVRVDGNTFPIGGMRIGNFSGRIFSRWEFEKRSDFVHSNLLEAKTSILQILKIQIKISVTMLHSSGSWKNTSEMTTNEWSIYMHINICVWWLPAMCYLVRGIKLCGLSLATSLEPLAHRQNVAS